MKKSLLAAAALLISSQAFAQTVDSAKSQLAFTMKQLGAPVSGSFKKFTPKVNFDPAQAEKGSADFTIDVSSISLPTAEANAEAKKKDWFNSAQFPQARFISSSIKSLGGNRYQVNGKLTIKGISRDVSAPFTATTQGKTISIDGTMPVSRLAFNIGDGSWRDTATVADNVDLRFRVVLVN